MGDNVHSVESSVPFQRRCYLALRGPPCIEHDGVDLRPQISKDRLNIRNGRIDEENFCWASHDHILFEFWVQTNAALAARR